jgi:hypothetical protein
VVDRDRHRSRGRLTWARKRRVLTQPYDGAGE